MHQKTGIEPYNETYFAIQSCICTYIYTYILMWINMYFVQWAASAANIIATDHKVHCALLCVFVFSEVLLSYWCLGAVCIHEPDGRSGKRLCWGCVLSLTMFCALLMTLVWKNVLEWGEGDSWDELCNSVYRLEGLPVMGSAVSIPHYDGAGKDSLECTPTEVAEKWSIVLVHAGHRVMCSAVISCQVLIWFMGARQSLTNQSTFSRPPPHWSPLGYTATHGRFSA